MVTNIFLMFVLLFIIFVTKKITERKHLGSKKTFRKFPNGPPKLPIIGNVHQLGLEPHKSFLKLSKKYGHIFSIQLGSVPAIVLNHHKDIKEAFALPSLNGRLVSDDLLIHCGGTQRGIVFNQGKNWIEQRRFTIKALRNFGFGRTDTTESIILEEVAELIETLKEVVNQPRAIGHEFFHAPFSNVIMTIANGERVNHKDPVLLDLIDSLKKFTRQKEEVSVFVFFPFLSKLRRFLPSSYEKAVLQLQEKIMNYVNKMISNHEISFHENDEPRDFIDMYLKQLKMVKNPSSSFFGEEGKKNLAIVLFDLFAAGSETGATTLNWVFLLLALHPNIQEKLHQEIKEVIDPRPPRLSDRAMMPYTDAIIYEVLRFNALVPLSVPHTATEDFTVFKDYVIPQGTLIIPNLYGAMRDPQVWRDPDTFRPERFLENPSLKEAVVTFSAGKRICPGMALGQDEAFLFMVSLFQRFRVEPPAPHEGEPLKIKYSKGTVLIPTPQKMVLRDRFLY